MKVRELIAMLQAMPADAEVLTDNIGFTKLEAMKAPQLNHVMTVAGEYLPCRADEGNAVAVVYVEAPGV